MSGQIEAIGEALAHPDRIVKSRSDETVELYYRWHPSSPVSQKHLCVAVKSSQPDRFVVTGYFTDTVKRGDVLWTKK